MRYVPHILLAGVFIYLSYFLIEENPFKSAAIRPVELVDNIISVDLEKELDNLYSEENYYEYFSDNSNYEINKGKIKEIYNKLELETKDFSIKFLDKESSPKNEREAILKNEQDPSEIYILKLIINDDGYTESLSLKED